MLNQEKKPDDIVIVGSYRTPLTKAKRGGLSSLKNNEIIYEHLKNTLNKIKLSPKMIDYVFLGNALSELNGTVDAKHGCLRANIKVETPILTVNRQCASGLESFEIVKNMIELNKIEIGLVGGFESMTTHELPLGNINDHGDSEIAEGCKLSMLEASERLAKVYGLNREEIDDFAYKSHMKAFEANKNSKFVNEILPVGDVKSDDCIRAPDRAKIGSLKPVLENGVTTAANACQLADGCSLALLMKRKVAEKLNLEIQGRFVDYLVVGVDPSIMGIGPAEVVPKLLRKHNLKVSDISAFEINEAFGAQALYCMKSIGIPEEKFNVNGGSIALGHPLGCTGARLVSTILNVMDKGLGVVSLCAGTGHGAAALIIKE